MTNNAKVAKPRRSLPLFYKIYFSALGVFVLLLVIGAVAFNGWLADYNETLPETISENFFASVFASGDTDSLLSLSGAKPSEFETEEDLAAYIEQTFASGDLSYTSISTGSTALEKKYIVKSGEYKVADFSLIKNPDGSWSPMGVRLHLPKAASVSCKVLSSSTLFIGDKAVEQTYVTDRTPHEHAAYLPDGVQKPEWVTYTVSGLTKTPEISVIDRNGNAPELVPDQDGVFCESVLYDIPENDITDRLVTAAKKYAACMQNDASKSSVYPYFEKGTPLYESIRTAENMFVWDHNGYAFEDEAVSEFFRYDENTVSVRIAFTHILKKAGRQDYRDRTDITYFARKIDGKYMIFARYNN